jgi:2'-5' RNA ligase
MTRIARDIVLLPSAIMMERAIEINEELLKENEDKIMLHQEKCLPHISLCMGCIDEDKIPEIKNILDEISTEFSPFNLQAIDLEAEIIPTGKKVSSLVIKNKDKLQKLHETIMKKLWNYLSYDVEISMLFNPPEVEEVTLYWIKNYANYYYNPSLFHPHITVGFGETAQFQMPIDFTASQIALCQLGNYCTCRKVIISSDIK